MRVLAEIGARGVNGQRPVTLVKLVSQAEITPLDWSATGLRVFLLDQEPTLGGGVAGVHGRPRS